ncbi:hypothetical protein UlMin_028587 [Ulmus minor]
MHNELQNNDINLPIAKRKGVQPCTNHPIYNFLSYNGLSPVFRAFSTNLTEIRIPNNIHEALQTPQWKVVVGEEIRAVENNGTWEITDLPIGKKIRLVKRYGYSQCQSNHTMFVKHSLEGKMAIIIVYVDDIILTRDHEKELCKLKNFLAKEFELKDLGNLKYFLGIEIARSKKGIVVSQRKYVLDLLKETGMLGCKPANTPMDQKIKLGREEGSVLTDKGRYQHLVGKLIYLSHTIPDIGFSVSVVNQFMHDPTEEHMEAVYRILRYLKMTPGKGLYFKRTTSREIEIFTDADYAGSVTNRRSTSG